MAKFKDIPQLTERASYRIDVSWNYIEDTFRHWSEGPSSVDVDPDFQRAHVWEEVQQQRYVEFILRGGQSAKELMFNCTTWDIETSMCLDSV